MTLHDRLKQTPVDVSRPTTAWHTVAIGTVLALFAAGFAVAMPLAAMRPATESGERSLPRDRPLASPSIHPPSVTLPSPAVPARPEEDTEVATAPGLDVDEDVAGTDLSGSTNEKKREVAKRKTVTPPDDKHGKRAPDDPGDHDKGYGNDPGRSHKSTPDGKKSGGKKSGGKKSGGKKGKKR